MIERLAEAAPSLSLGRLIGLDNMNKVLAASRRRVDDSHKAQMLKLQEVTGQPFDLQESTEDEEVGIRVSGDTTYEAPKSNSLPGTIAALISAAALPLAGIGVSKLLENPATPPPPAVTHPSDSVDRDNYLPYDLTIE